MNKLLLVGLLLLTSTTAFCDDEVPEVYTLAIVATNPNEIILNDCLLLVETIAEAEREDYITECYRVFNEAGVAANPEPVAVVGG